MIGIGSGDEPAASATAKEEPSRCTSTAVTLCWTIGSIALFPQGLMPVVVKLGGGLCSLALRLSRPRRRQGPEEPGEPDGPREAAQPALRGGGE